MNKPSVAHPLEMLVLFVAAVCLSAAVGFTVQASSENNESGDLTFANTTRELSLLLAAGGRDQLAKLDIAQLPLGNDTLEVNKITLLAQGKDEPSVDLGGFISDQVATYNDHAIRRAITEKFALGPRVRGDDGISLFRTMVNENGDRVLSDRPNPSVLTVRSPFAERNWPDVRTSDWRRSGGILGLAGDIAVTSDTVDQSHSSINGRDCTIRIDDQQRFLLYCQSTLASDVGKFFDVGFNPRNHDGALGFNDLFTDRRNEIWRNGERRTSRDEVVRSGDVFDVPAIGPFVVSQFERGALAAGQWVNGRRTFSNQRLGTISFFASAGRSSSSSRSGPIVLALDAALSFDLESESQRFLDTHNTLERMSVVVMDARTGEVRAVVEPTRHFVGDPLLAFEPVLLGSVVKPIIAASVISRQPNLAALTLQHSDSIVASVGGFSLQSSFESSLNGCTAPIGFTDFIRCSNNQFAAELLVGSLRRDGLNPSIDPIIPRDVLERSSLGSGLAEAFDVDAFAQRTAGRNDVLWIPPDQSAPLTANRALMPWEPRPWIVFPRAQGTPVDWLARYAFGGWENRWTLIGVAQAYARIATGRQVNASFLSRSRVPTPAAAPPNVEAAFSRVRPALRRVPVDGTASGLARDLARSLPPQTTVLAKTGTLNEETDRFKALSLVIGETENGNASAELSCGLVTISYFEFSDGLRQKATRGRLPPVHLEFARGNFASVLQRHFMRLSGCARP